MVAANVKIIEELKSFLEIVASDSEIRSLFTENETDFTRDRKLTMERVVGIIINMPKRSLSIEIQDFFNSLGEDLDGCTKSAFSLQRAKLNPLFFTVWNKWLVDNFYLHYGKSVKRWRGFLLYAVDGSFAYLFNKEEVVNHFGTHRTAPMARIMQIQDVLNDLSVGGGIYPFKKSEKAIIAEQIEQLRTDSLAIFDRGYPGFVLMYLMANQEEPRNYLIRCPLTFNKEVIQFVRSRKSNKIVEFKPSDKSIVTLKKNGIIVTKDTTIKVRMVKIRLPNGTIEILLTNLYNEKLYKLNDFKYLYNKRWGIETAYYKEKNQLQMEQFSGHRVICIEQDFAATLFVANLQSIIEKQCTDYLRSINEKRKHNYKINKNISIASLKNNIIHLFFTETPELILIKLQKMFERNIEPIRPDRQYERISKVKNLNGKFQTFTNYKRAV